ncbi:SMC-Scp complex subunit ScpB [Nocardia sp. XZ_19_369]|uniref:SMC-Scp complex subunit ScpB n=1 Tax=Nocardia sp. XZ_19_369 TaxID=2769487 RepID=UPI00188EE4AB
MPAAATKSADTEPAIADVSTPNTDTESAATDADPSDADDSSTANNTTSQPDPPNATTYDATPVANNTVAEFTPERLEDAEFRSALEAMLLVVDAPAPVEQLAAALDDTTERVDEVLREMRAELSARGNGIDLRFVGDGWRFYTRSEYAPYVERVLLDGARTKLTRAALETLAVVAYRQPVTRTRVSAVRGVNVDGVMRTLLARGLLAEAGVDPETNGTMYCTTELFLERIGLASLSDLPPLAPLLPGVDLIDEINESLDTDPRYTRLKKPAEADLDLGSED